MPNWYVDLTVLMSLENVRFHIKANIGFAYTALQLPSATLLSQTGPALSLGYRRPSPSTRSLTYAAILLN